MKKFFIGSMLIVTLCAVSINNVDAKSVYFTNSKGVEMTELEYNKMLKLYSQRKVDVLSQEEFDMYKDANIIVNDKIYQEVTYKDDELISEKEITEEEYNNAKVNNSGITPYVSDFIETNYKRLSSTIVETNGHFAMINALSWKQVPKYRSYDVFAFRLKNLSYDGFSGLQTYIINGSSYDIRYDTSSEGYKGFSDGAGVSMNLKDGSNITGYELTTGTRLNFSTHDYNKAYAFVSYQHAQANLSRAQSMSYSLSLSGLGNVIYYADTSIRSLYDNMAGLQLEMYIV